MMTSHWRFGVLLVGLIGLDACTSKKEEPAVNATENPAASPAVAAGTDSAKSIKQAWPIEDLVIVQDYGEDKSVPNYVFRIHMDVPASITTDLEHGVSTRNGDTIMKALGALGNRDRTRAWATLKAILGCQDYSAGNSTCNHLAGAEAAGKPSAQYVVVRDYSEVEWPADKLRIQLDFPVNKPALVDLQRVLGQAPRPGYPDRNALFQILTGDNVIQANSSKISKATVKAVLGCAQIDSDLTRC